MFDDQVVGSTQTTTRTGTEQSGWKGEKAKVIHFRTSKNTQTEVIAVSIQQLTYSKRNNLALILPYTIYTYISLYQFVSNPHDYAFLNSLQRKGMI